MKQVIRQDYIDRITAGLKADKLVLLTGARQVGKTTLMLQVEQQLWLPSLLVNMEDWFGEDRTSKEDFLDWISLKFGFDVYSPGLLMLDEVQYLRMPEALLKSLYDDRKIQCFILATGSRFRWQQRVGSSLVGRWRIIRVYSYSFLEFLRAKWLHVDQQKLETISYKLIEKYLQEYQTYGGYPAVVHASIHTEKIDRMEEIVWRMLEKDFTTYISHDELISFRKVFQSIARSIGSLWKTNKIAQILELSNYKVEKYLQFLEDLYMIESVYPYFTDRTKEYKSQKEFFFHDIGLHSYFVGNRESPVAWKVIENLVYLNLKRNQKYRTINYRKNRAGSEIDFVVETKDNKLVPIEVKSGDKTHIPRIFHSFFSTYHDSIEYGVVTTKSLQKQERVGDKVVYFVPYWR